MVDSVLKDGGEVTYDYQQIGRSQPPGPKFLRRILGEHAFAEVSNLGLKTAPSEDLPQVFSDLKVLGFENTTLDMMAFERIARFEHLNHLSLRNCTVPSEGIERLAALSNLTSLELFGVSATSDNLLAVSTLKQLEKLWISHTVFGWRSFDLVGDSRYSTPLEVPLQSNSDWMSFRCLGELPKLKYLAISGSLEDESFASLTRLRNLRYIVIHHSVVGERAIQYLAAIPSLETLDLSGTRLPPRSSQYLLQCDTLRELRLLNARVDDSAMVHLGKMTRLRCLDLGGNQITDDGLQALAHLKSLEELDLELSAGGITPQGVKWLKEQLPNCGFSVSGPGADYPIGLGEIDDE